MNLARAIDFSVSCPADTTAPAQTSQSKTLETSKVLALHQISGEEFKRWFAPKLAEYLQDRFSNPEQVAFAFKVRSSTAWNWWAGSHKASGDAVGRMFMVMPEAVAWFMAEWEGRT